MDFQQLAKADPIKRMVERQSETEELSPMDPPDAYAPPGTPEADITLFPDFVRDLASEHITIREELDLFEKVLDEIKEKGPGKNASQGLTRFFTFLDNHLVVHNQLEEKVLFPLLNERMKAAGDHSNGPGQQSGIDMLEDDHAKMLQLAAVCFNFIALSARLPDRESGMMVLDAGLEQGKVLIESLKLHIFREDNIVFPLAEKHLSAEELQQMKDKAKSIH